MPWTSSAKLDDFKKKKTKGKRVVYKMKMSKLLCPCKWLHRELPSNHCKMTMVLHKCIQTTKIINKATQCTEICSKSVFTQPSNKIVQFITVNTQFFIQTNIYSNIYLYIQINKHVNIHSSQCQQRGKQSAGHNTPQPKRSLWMSSTSPHPPFAALDAVGCAYHQEHLMLPLS